MKCSKLLFACLALAFAFSTMAFVGNAQAFFVNDALASGSPGDEEPNYPYCDEKDPGKCYYECGKGGCSICTIKYKCKDRYGNYDEVVGKCELPATGNKAKCSEVCQSKEDQTRKCPKEPPITCSGGNGAVECTCEEWIKKGECNKKPPSK